MSCKHRTTATRPLGQVFLHEPRAEMHIDLNEWRITNTAEAVDLSSLDDKNITLIRSDELMRAAHKGQVLLTNAVHFRGSRQKVSD